MCDCVQVGGGGDLGSTRDMAELERKANDYDQLLERVSELQQVRVRLEHELAPLRAERTSILSENAALREGSNADKYLQLKTSYTKLSEQCVQLQRSLTLESNECELLRLSLTLESNECELLRRSLTLESNECELLRRSLTLESNECELLRLSLTLESNECELLRRSLTLESNECELLRRSLTLESNECELLRRSLTLESNECELLQRSLTLEKNECELLQRSLEEERAVKERIDGANQLLQRQLEAAKEQVTHLLAQLGESKKRMKRYRDECNAAKLMLRVLKSLQNSMNSKLQLTDNVADYNPEGPQEEGEGRGGAGAGGGPRRVRVRQWSARYSAANKATTDGRRD